MTIKTRGQGQTDRPNDRPTDRLTDIATYRAAIAAKKSVRMIPRKKVTIWRYCTSGKKLFGSTVFGGTVLACVTLGRALVYCDFHKGGLVRQLGPEGPKALTLGQCVKVRVPPIRQEVEV